MVEVLPVGRGFGRLFRRTFSFGAELYSYAAAEVYEQRTGDEIYGEHAEPDSDNVGGWDPKGEPFEEDSESLSDRYPRLAAVFLH